MSDLQQHPNWGFSLSHAKYRANDADEAYLQCAVRENDRDGAWVSIRGELDLAGVPALRHALDSVQRTARLVILDLRGLTFMDLTGLRAIIDAEAQARRGRQRLVLIRGPAQVDRLLALVGQSAGLEIVDVPGTRTTSTDTGAAM